MDDDTEIILKKMCCTCLSDNRKLFQLCRVVDGVNNLYWLLSFDTEAYREGFYKDSTNLYICWECKAIMSRICCFRSQVCTAQKHLTNVAEGRCDNTITILSKLTYTLNDDFDHTFVYTNINQEVMDNFIDCGPIVNVKEETDLDGLPLVGLGDNFIPEDNVKPTLKQSSKCLNLNSGKVRKKYIIDHNIKENDTSTNSNELYYSMLDNNEEETLKRKKSKKFVPNYVDDAFKCESCFIAFKVQNELDKHNMEIHGKNYKSQAIKSPGSKPRRNKTMNDKRTPYGFLCIECDKYFDTKKTRWLHVQRTHREGFACTTCGKRFPFKNNLTRHEQTHAPPPPRAPCATCGKRVRADLMRAHARVHTERARHSCAPCGKSFASRASYEHHLKYTVVHAVNDIFKYKCSVCDKGYKSKGELRDHINYQHMGKTQHKCPVCGKALATQRCVTRHVKRTHEGIKENERDKICQQCGKAFRDKKGLREHELIHTGERPLSCEICGCTFRQNATLYTHKKRVHKIYPKRKQVELMESEKR